MPLSNILEIIANNPHAAYTAIFLISLLESLAFVGLLVPGTVLMFGIGALIATGALSLKATLIVAAAGAIAGDGISYWLGRYHHQRLRSLWPFHRYPQMLSRGETFFHRHGGTSVLFGRFIGPLRPVIPIVAGTLDMPPLKFTLVNVLSAIGWAFGFPSGHTTMSVILYGFLAILIAKGLRSAMQWGLFVTVFLICFVIAFSRLYLGVHWLSDVLGGFFLASAWTALAGISYLKGRPEVIPRRLLSLVTLMVVLTVGSWHVVDRHNRDLVFYARRHSVQMMDLQTWLKNGWEDLPTWRIDIRGEREQPLTIQCAGSSECLAQYLVSKGWHIPPALNLKTFLGMLSPDTRVRNLPLLPHLHDGRLEKALLVREEGAERWVFRLWPTDTRFKEAGRSLWVGTMETQVAYRIADLITVPKDKGDYIGPLEVLSQALKRRFGLREAFRRSDELQSGDEPHGLVWNGQVLLIMETPD